MTMLKLLVPEYSLDGGSLAALYRSCRIVVDSQSHGMSGLKFTVLEV